MWSIRAQGELRTLANSAAMESISVAFLIRTTRGPVLLTGDACITTWGWEHTVEPGDFTADHARNLKNLQNMKRLVAYHPQIEVYLGHQH
ncbi:hypothetical protein [Ferriphaselus sp. R-1]|uniref:hypothetical protein n=1 Tax=Ferriphaselus sp. R-1 TaxID=1485544 RepID=UPI001F28A2C2|nr:hypothetical protein [Ferriphaselus sp. R-1]